MAFSGKVAFVSHVLPPSSSGQAVVLYRLLRSWDPKHYCVISVKDYTNTATTPADSITARLAGAYYQLPNELQFRLVESPVFQAARAIVAGARQLGGLLTQDPAPAATATGAASGDAAPLPPSSPPSSSALARFKRGCRATLQSWDDWLNLRSQVKQRARAIEKVVRAERCTALVACSGDLIDLPAGFLAARAAGIPFYSYMFDDYARQWTMPSMRRFGNDVCAQVIGQADRVIVPNEFLANAYRETYGVEAAIVRNPVEDVPPLAERPAFGKPLRIVFTGTIYEAHFDAFIRMMQAVGRLAGAVEFHVYTHSAPRFLAHNGVGPPAIVHPPVSTAAALAIQRSADVLFLPLAFASPYPEIVNTAAPGKMGEYLASGRPVLVHAPRESYLSWYCSRHECAAVVDAPDADWLYRTIVDLLERPAYCEHLVKRAWRQARADFHLPQVADCFEQLFAPTNSRAAA